LHWAAQEARCGGGVSLKHYRATCQTKSSFLHSIDLPSAALRSRMW
jgi:hypothetical protein